MEYTAFADSPLGMIRMTSDGEALTGLWFEKEPAEESGGGEKAVREGAELPVFAQTRRWLAIYFSGREPDFTPPVRFGESSAFRRAVWERLRSIPYGQTVTYGEIAEEIAAQRGIAKMSAQAVGGAVGNNPVSLIVPCHRVVGAGGRLVGYGGGLWRKEWLLESEKADERSASSSVWKCNKRSD